MQRTRILLSAVALIAWSGCDGGLDGPGELPEGLPEGWGAVEIALSAQEAGAANLSGKLTITDASDSTKKIERTYTSIDTTRVLDRIPLEPGTYNLALEVSDDDNLQTYFGSKDGVIVKAGTMSNVALYLQPSGSVAVVAKLTKHGHHFTCEPTLGMAETSVGASIFGSFVGAQRLEGGALKYYLWAEKGLSVSAGPRDYLLFTSSDAGSWSLFNSGTPNSLVTAELPCVLDSVQAIGDEFVGLCSDRRVASPTGSHALEVRSYDGVYWRSTEIDHRLDAAAAVVTSGTLETRWYDQLGGCVEIGDNQYNLFCLAQDAFIGSNSLAAFRDGLLYAWSADGVTWSDFPALKVADADNPAGHLESFDFALASEDIGDSFFASTHRPNSNKVWSLLSAALEGSVYRLWFRKEIGTSATTHVYLTESLDRRRWSTPQSVTLDTCTYSDPSQTGTSADSTVGRIQSWAAFTVPATASAPAEMHVIAVGTDGGLGAPILHYKSVN